MTGDADRREPATVRNSTSVLLNGLRVMAAFSIEEPVLGVTEIARKVDMHKSSVSRILATLEHAGYVERDSASGRFRLGLGLLTLAGPLLADLDVRRAASPALERLTRRSRETSALMVWNGHEAVVVEQVASPQQVKHTAAIGTRYDTYESASVQVFLAGLPPGEVRQLIERGLRGGAGDEQAIEGVLRGLDEVRVQGYAVNNGRTSIEEVGIAAGVRDHRGEQVAAVLLSAPRFRMSPQLIEAVAHDVVDAAREVSARLGNPG
ncbi:IclR family transcriptional regulator [Pseudonocardia hispaniensis]|uniref:IclR family transcriptional regulator n=1 Tax=Pseudonocardia hispaniensis TaxID=904933 RepID=A0ABW1J1S5_9PSEU